MRAFTLAGLMVATLAHADFGAVGPCACTVQTGPAAEQGAFFPYDQLRIDGVRRELGSRLTIGSLDAAATPLLANAEASLARVLGRASAPLTLGGLTAIAEQQRGVASLGLAVGLTRRLTFAVTVPIVSARTQLQLRTDAAGASARLNPAGSSLGTAARIARPPPSCTAFHPRPTARARTAPRCGRGERRRGGYPRRCRRRLRSRSPRA